MRTQELYVHFRPDEKAFVDKAWDWIERVALRRETRRSDFLDPRQAFVLSSLARRRGGVALRLDGGYPEAERKRAIAVPDFLDPEDEPPGIAVLAVASSDRRVAELEHGDYLGAILGLGVKREKIGDLHVRPDGCHILVAEEIAEFLALHLHQVHRVRVTADIVPLSGLRVVPVVLEETVLSAASMRLDAVAGDAFRLSRAKIAELIRAGRCRVNWKTEEDPSAALQEGDVVSLKGYGRIKVIGVEGTSRSGRTLVRIGKFV